jgi:hypothetical protein
VVVKVKRLERVHFVANEGLIALDVVSPARPLAIVAFANDQGREAGGRGETFVESIVVLALRSLGGRRVDRIECGRLDAFDGLEGGRVVTVADRACDGQANGKSEGEDDSGNSHTDWW